ncbi:acyl-CoA dehydrogenase family protein, partial [Streptomyces lydicus]
MVSQLTTAQQAEWNRFRDLMDHIVAPEADSRDIQQSMPRELVKSLAREGLLSSLLPREWGGAETDAVTYGLMSEEMGRTCSNVRNFVAVEDMVSHSIWKWGTDEQQERWLPAIASGEKVGSFALTEPHVGSDAKSVTTQARMDGATVVLRGTKQWISFGQIADVLLVFAQLEGRHTAFLVPADTPGVQIQPQQGLLGLRGSMLARIVLDDCRVPTDAMIGNAGSGLAFVASSALDIGRYSTAWGCVGLAQACRDISSKYATERVQFGVPIGEHQLVRRMLADMVTGVHASRLLCWEAGVAREQADLDTVTPTLEAKYFASRVASRTAADAVQIHG